MLFDTHAHLDFYPEEKIPQIIERAKRAGVERILTIGTDLNSSRKAWEISKSYEGVLLSVGIHPHDSEEVTEEDLESLYELAKKGEVVAIGETGLDFYRNYSPPEAQKRVFYAHIEMAKSLDLPLIIHSRKALNETYKILKEKRVENFVMHCFSGSVEEADFFLKLGGVISLAGPLTFKNARKPQKLAAKVPLSFLLLETDSPYLAPHPYRGKENEPCYLQFIARKLAEIKELSFEEVAEETSKNAFKIFSK